MGRSPKEVSLPQGQLPTVNEQSKGLWTPGYTDTVRPSYLVPTETPGASYHVLFYFKGRGN